MGDGPLTDRFGNALVSFDPVAGAELEDRDDAVPAIFRLVLPALPPLAGDEEILGFQWWDPRSPVTEDMSPLDAEIGRRVSARWQAGLDGSRP